MSTKAQLPAEKARNEPAFRSLPGGSPATAGRIALVAVAGKPASQGRQIAPAVANPHFGRIGGIAAIRQLTESFYRNMSTVPEAAAIRAMHPADLSGPQETLIKYLVGWMGGPPLYAAERGQPRLRHAHLAFAIGEAERNAWMKCMELALAEVVADEGLRLELSAAFRKLASTVRNR